MPRGPVPEATVRALGLAAVSNVHELVAAADLLEGSDDDELIDARGHKARSIALSILAAEELAKVLACSLVLEHAGEDPQDWRGFWRVFGRRRHEDKIDALLWLEELVVAQANGIKAPDEMAAAFRQESAAGLFELKNRAMYVDIEDGDILTPVQAVDDESLARAKRIRKSATVWAVTLSLSMEG
jgi:AbiV family abortive infection protein